MKTKRRPERFATLLLLSMALTPLATHAQWVTVYTNGFQGAVGPEWSALNTDITPIGGRRFLGQFSNQVVTLTMTQLPPHSAATVSFDLFVIRSWDGSYTENTPSGCCGPDEWDLSVASGPTLLRSSFSNVDLPAYPQSFPDAYPGPAHPARTGAAESNTLGFRYPLQATGNLMDSVYRLSFTFQHRSNALALRFSAPGSGMQAITNESWGLDNIVVAVLPLPSLAIVQQGGGQAVLSWPGWASNYLVEVTSTFTPANWMTVNRPVTMNGDRQQMVIDESDSSAFYRLRRD